MQPPSNPSVLPPTDPAILSCKARLLPWVPCTVSLASHTHPAVRPGRRLSCGIHHSEASATHSETRSRHQGTHRWTVYLGVGSVPPPVPSATEASVTPQARGEAALVGWTPADQLESPPARIKAALS